MVTKLWGAIKKESRGLVWNESQMTTGFPEIDAQHKKWIAMFNQFENAIINQRGEEICPDAILFFVRYTETHFRDEETLMELHHCSAQYTNKMDHEKFKSRLQEFTYMTWPLGATANDVFSLRNELVEWMRNHICTIDVKLRDVVKKPG